MKKLLERPYGANIAALGFAALMIISEKLNSPTMIGAIIVGLMLGFLPSVLSGAAVTASAKESEKKRSLVMFCLYLFVLLWLTSFPKNEATDITIMVLGAAICYHLAFFSYLELQATRKEGVTQKNPKAILSILAVAGLSYFIYQLIVQPPLTSSWNVALLIVLMCGYGLLKRFQTRKVASPS